MSKPRLKLFFSDFWFDFDPENNFFTNLFRGRFAVTIDPSADLLVCSVFGSDWSKFSGKKLFFSGEAIPPEPRLFDYSLSFSPRSETNYYLPLYRLYADYPRLTDPRSITEEAWAKKKKIGTVFSNKNCHFRNWAFHRFDSYIGVGSGGKAFNNVGGPVPDKRVFWSSTVFLSPLRMPAGLGTQRKNSSRHSIHKQFLSIGVTPMSVKSSTPRHSFL